MLVKFICLCLVFCTFTSVFGQTFQYSRGWRNGKRGEHVTMDSACQLLRIRSILDGKFSNQDDLPCNWRYFAEPDQNQKFNQQKQLAIPPELEEI